MDNSLAPVAQSTEWSFLRIDGFEYRYRLASPGRLRQFIKKFIRQQGSGCWLWQGALDTYVKRYGITSWKGKSLGAHRLAHILFKGDIPFGYEVHHTCKSERCVNPDHLEAVEPKTHHDIENSSRHKPFCPKGHPMSGNNVYVFPGTDKRACRTCRRESVAEARELARVEQIASGEVEQRHIKNDGRRKSRLMLTHCRRGHEFTPENTRMFQGRRYCKKCHAENTLKYYHDRKSVALSAQGS